MSLSGDKYTIKDKFKHLPLANTFQIVSTARKGISPKIFYDFTKAIKITEQTLAAMINLSARTISNYHEQQKLLEPVHSEHLLKLIALFDKGETLFGGLDEFNYWLKKPFWKSKDTPLDWMITSGGVDLLMDELDKLAQGHPV